MTRMDRYKNDDTNKKISRIQINEELYENIGNNTKLTNITDVTNTNVTELNNSSNEYKTREDYQKLIQCGAEPKYVPPIKKELDEFNNVYSNHESKTYDINDFLEEARKNREVDIMDEKRKLKNTSYNILANMNIEELEKFRREKQERITNGNDNLKELIDTIASKTLAGDIEVASDLLSDLMATSIMDKITKDDENEIKENDEINAKKTANEKKEDQEEKEEQEEYEEDNLSLSKNILDKEELEEIRKITETQETITENEINNDFYTKTLDLKPEDFEDNENNEENEISKKLPIIVKILILIVIIAIISLLTIYFFK